MQDFVILMKLTLWNLIPVSDLKFSPSTIHTYIYLNKPLSAKSLGIYSFHSYRTFQEESEGDTGQLGPELSVFFFPEISPFVQVHSEITMGYKS